MSCFVELVRLLLVTIDLACSGVLFPAIVKKAFSYQIWLHKGEHVFLGFKLLKPFANKKCTKGSGKCWGSLFVQKMPRWENGKCCFLKQITIGAHVHSLSTIYFASRKLPASCFLELVRFHQTNFTLDCYGLFSPACEKMTFSYQIRLLHKGESILCGF